MYHILCAVSYHVIIKYSMRNYYDIVYYPDLYSLIRNNEGGKIVGIFFSITVKQISKNNTLCLMRLDIKCSSEDINNF